MNIVDLGLIGYKEAEALQLETLKAVTDRSKENTVYVLEHPKVITLGRRAEPKTCTQAKSSSPSRASRLSKPLAAATSPAISPASLLPTPSGAWKSAPAA